MARQRKIFAAVHPLRTGFPRAPFCGASLFKMEAVTGDGVGLMPAGGARASSASITANSFPWRAPTGTERLVEVDCFRKLLADEIIAPREFAVCKLGMLRLGPSGGDFLSLGSFFELGLLKK